MSLVKLQDVRRTYHVGKVAVPALRGVSLVADAGEFVAIVGPSGSGKTTLLNLAGLLDHPESGEIWLGSTATSMLSESQRAALRREHIGFIFQAFNLLGHLTAEENVAMPLRYGGHAAASPADLLERVGLSARRTHRPDELSGGEQQRVAIARALIGDPPIILADEPTGDLDTASSAQIVSMLLELCAEGKTVLVVTHNPEVAAAATRVVRMRDGLIE